MRSQSFRITAVVDSPTGEEKEDPNAGEQLDHLAAFPIIWDRFLDPATPLKVLATCDQILMHMSPGWRTHPTRYDVMVKALRRHSRLAVPVENSQVDSTLFVNELLALSHFLGRERQIYQLFEEIIDSSPGYGSFTLSHLPTCIGHIHLIRINNV